jgi:hypothetical protein
MWCAAPAYAPSRTPKRPTVTGGLAERYLPNLLAGLPTPVQKSQPAPAR